MENLLCYLLMVFITKSVADPLQLKCYVTPYTEKVKPCMAEVDKSSNSREQKHEDAFKCANEAKPELNNDCEGQCFTMTGEYKDKKVVFYGCSLDEKLCNVYKTAIVRHVFGKEAQPGSCEYCFTDECNLKGQNPGENSGQNPGENSGQHVPIETSEEPLGLADKNGVKNSATWIVPKITMTFLNIVFHFIL